MSNGSRPIAPRVANVDPATTASTSDGLSRDSKPAIAPDISDQRGGLLSTDRAAPEIKTHVEGAFSQTEVRSQTQVGRLVATMQTNLSSLESHTRNLLMDAARDEPTTLAAHPQFGAQVVVLSDALWRAFGR